MTGGRLTTIGSFACANICKPQPDNQREEQQQEFQNGIDCRRRWFTVLQTLGGLAPRHNHALVEANPEETFATLGWLNLNPRASCLQRGWFPSPHRF